MSTVVDLDVLKINYLTQAQYEEAISQGIIEEDEIYMTPSSGSGVSDVLVDNVSVVSGGVADIDLSGKADAADIPTKVSDLTNDAGYISGYTETDPVFAASAAHGITSANISTWNGKYAKPSGGIPESDLASSVQTSLGLADTALQSYTETDPTVPAWAKASSKPSYTASEVGALPDSTSIPSATSDLTNDSGFLNASGILNLFYPIGSYYETSDTDFDPNVSWGGTWVLEAEGQVHVSAGTNYAVSGALTNTTDGGEETHTLTIDEMPSHTHDVTSLNGALYTDYLGTGSAVRVIGPASAQAVGNPFYANSAGGSLSHNIMQPYIVVNRWHRTA